MEKEKPKVFLLFHNLGKPRNLGMVLRSAAAFDVDEIFLIQPNQNKTERFKQISKYYKMFFGDKGTMRGMKYRVFQTINSFKQYSKENNILTCIISNSNDENSSSLNDLKIEKNICLIIPNYFENSEIKKSFNSITENRIKIENQRKIDFELDFALISAILFQKIAEKIGKDEVDCFGEKFKKSVLPKKDKFLSVEFYDKDISLKKIKEN